MRDLHIQEDFLQHGKISVCGGGKEEILGMREWNIQKH